METLRVAGENPQPRFGHTVTYVGQGKAVLFGGAMGDTGKYEIISETYILDCARLVWTKATATGTIPKQRAAHAATAVDSLQMVVFGGATGGGGLANDDLYMFDLREGETNARWLTVPVVGSTPGKRYGHSLTFAKPYLVLFGGNTGNEPVNDSWILNVERSPYQWTKLQPSSELPAVRVYHAAAHCSSGAASGMVVVFGGRTADSSALADTWGLRRHRDGRWDWVRAPYKQGDAAILGRYQHQTLFIGPIMIVLGGRTNNMADVLTIDVYNTETSEWTSFPSIDRFRHAAWALESMVYVHGGFEPNVPNVPVDTLKRVDLTRLFQSNQRLSRIIPASTPAEIPTDRPTRESSEIKEVERQGTQKTIRLANQALVATTYGPADDITVKRVAITKLPEEGKKLGLGFQSGSGGGNEEALAMFEMFVLPLLRLRDCRPPATFPAKRDDVAMLARLVTRVFEAEAAVVRLRAPLQIFGRIPGQLTDLLRFFAEFGAPTEVFGEGDLDSFDYLFLGNLVDRGMHSLEVVCLLLALKLRFPDQMHIIRGAHEDIRINRLGGLAEECSLKLGEDILDPNSAFSALNRAFEAMPIAATIDDRVFASCAGIGQTSFTLADLDTLRKPITLVADPQTKLQKVANEIISTGECDSEEQLSNFLKVNKLQMVVRGNNPVQEGIDEEFRGALVSVYGATNDGGKKGNNAAFLTLRKTFKTSGDMNSKALVPPPGAGPQNWMEERRSSGEPDRKVSTQKKKR
eukprot:TRINITY_DN3749_c0_g1_i5.p1 TRINITY_DN3749_c0_g1~~TRINITY_DN3749_c0_g1_i5.p1  ORF type:complete len:749 (+),score=142.71 TRINITY_DN3749_c0_g1_i5:79-2325(+)